MGKLGKTKAEQLIEMAKDLAESVLLEGGQQAKDHEAKAAKFLDACDELEKDGL
jgi:hypothetical protein